MVFTIPLVEFLRVISALSQKIVFKLLGLKITNLDNFLVVHKSYLIKEDVVL